MVPRKKSLPKAAKLNLVFQGDQRTEITSVTRPFRKSLDLRRLLPKSIHQGTKRRVRQMPHAGVPASRDLCLKHSCRHGTYVGEAEKRGKHSGTRKIKGVASAQDGSGCAHTLQVCLRTARVPSPHLRTRVSAGDRALQVRSAKKDGVDSPLGPSPAGGLGGCRRGISLLRLVARCSSSLGTGHKPDCRNGTERSQRLHPCCCGLGPKGSTPTVRHLHRNPANTERHPRHDGEDQGDRRPVILHPAITAQLRAVVGSSPEEQHEKRKQAAKHDTLRVLTQSNCESDFHLGNSSSVDDMLDHSRRRSTLIIQPLRVDAQRTLSLPSRRRRHLPSPVVRAAPHKLCADYESRSDAVAQGRSNRLRSARRGGGRKYFVRPAA